MRRAIKTNVSYKYTKRGRFRCPTFKVLAGNLNVENRKTPTVTSERNHYYYICSFTCKFLNVLNNSQRYVIYR